MNGGGFNLKKELGIVTIYQLIAFNRVFNHLVLARARSKKSRKSA